MARGTTAAVIAALVLCVAGATSATGRGSTVALLVYDNDIDGPAATAAGATVDRWSSELTVVTADSRGAVELWAPEGVYRHRVGGFPVACIVAVGDNADAQLNYWTDAAPGDPDGFSAQGHDRYDTAHRIRQALDGCVQ